MAVTIAVLILVVVEDSLGVLSQYYSAPWRLELKSSISTRLYISVREMYSKSWRRALRPGKIVPPSCLYLPNTGWSSPEMVHASWCGRPWESFLDFRYPRTVSAQGMQKLSVCWAIMQSSLASKWGQQKRSSKAWRRGLSVAKSTLQPPLQVAVIVG